MIEIPLTQGQMALIDDEDFELVSQYKWQARYDPHTRTFYAVRSTPRKDGKRGAIHMHRLIIGANNGEIVDHINHKTLDNRKLNLRLATHAENARNSRISHVNSSGYKGVCWHKQNKKWIARIKVNGKLKHLGYYENSEEAYAAYCKAAKIFHGEFACFD